MNGIHFSSRWIWPSAAFAALLLLPGGTLILAGEKQEAPGLSASANPETVKQINEMEEKLGRAIAARDAKLLDEMLADYFADAEAGSEHALSKKGILNRCRVGALIAYKFVNAPAITRTLDTVTIAGASEIVPAVAAEHPSSATDKTTGATFVRRIWAKTAGQWRLILQERKADDNKEEKDR